RGIGTDIHYPLPLQQQPVFAGCRVGQGGTPQAEKAAREIISLPMYPSLTREQIEATAGAIREWHATLP
ncbi:MAG: DegT/DnrJ/EryC1/StrS family aminotransferase, partial [Anaerolineae bacterium]|nr:DegT/DnrJ/EryC1/StrS family aminotransferase [Anaerolineae bacterium]